MDDKAFSEFVAYLRAKKAVEDANESLPGAPVLTEGEAEIAAAMRISPERYAAQRDARAAEEKALADKVKRDMTAALQQWKGLR